jgi:protein subunit release factor B
LHPRVALAVSKEKKQELKDRMDKLNIHEDDLMEKFILGSGPGGQKVNKTASCVYLKHLPSGIEVKCTKERSQDTNRYLARRELCEIIEKEIFGIKTSKEKEVEKIKKQKNRKARRSKRKLLKNLPDNL